MVIHIASHERYAQKTPAWYEIGYQVSRSHSNPRGQKFQERKTGICENALVRSTVLIFRHNPLHISQPGLTEAHDANARREGCSSLHGSRETLPGAAIYLYEWDGARQGEGRGLHFLSNVDGCSRGTTER
jgi:hypothetical protein